MTTPVNELPLTQAEVAEQLRQYARVLFDPTDIVEIRTLPNGKSKWITADVLHEQSWSLRLSSQGAQNIYAGANPRKHGTNPRKLDTDAKKCKGDKCAKCDLCVNRAHAIFADLDNTTIEEARQRLAATKLPPPTLIVGSGHGIHFYWRMVAPIADLRTWTNRQRDLAALLNSDPTIHNPSRIMRLPGFLNIKPKKGKPVLASIIEIDDGRQYEQADLADCIPHIERSEPSPAPSPSSNGVQHRGSSRLLTRAIKYLEKVDPAVEGQNGDGATFRAACVLVNDFGLSQEDAFELMIGDFNARCFPPWEPGALKEKIANAGAYAKKPKGWKAAATRDLRIPADAPTLSVSSTLEEVAQLESDAGNAARFALEHGKRFRFCYGPGHWLVNDGKRWKPDNAGEVVKAAKRTVQAIEDDKFSIKSQKRERISAMIELARPELAVNPAMLDVDPWLFNCLNGTIDLRTGILRPHESSDFITKLGPVMYDPSAPAPLWESVLDRTFAGDKSLIEFVEKIEGMALTGDVSEQIFPIYWGSGGNGKNVRLDTIAALMGDYACEAPPNLLTISTFEEHPTEIADLMGRRLVIGSETEEGARLRLQLVKRLTGNARLKGRFMRQDYFEFDRTFKLVLVTNNRPLVNENGEAAWRRLRLIPHNVVIPLAERDPDLPEKLKHEWPGILAWLVRGCLAWQRDGLGEPEAVGIATSSYRSESDVFGQFVAECCDTGGEKWSLSHDLRRDYERWATERGNGILQGKAYTKRLHEIGCVNQKRNGVRGWRGIALKPETPAEGDAIG